MKAIGENTSHLAFLYRQYFLHLCVRMGTRRPRDVKIFLCTFESLYQRFVGLVLTWLKLGKAPVCCQISFFNSNCRSTQLGLKSGRLWISDKYYFTKSATEHVQVILAICGISDLPSPTNCPQFELMCFPQNVFTTLNSGAVMDV